MNVINVIVENLKQSLYQCICCHEIAPAWYYHVHYHDGSSSNLSEFLTLTPKTNTSPCWVHVDFFVMVCNSNKKRMHLKTSSDVMVLTP